MNRRTWRMTWILRRTRLHQLSVNDERYVPSDHVGYIQLRGSALLWLPGMRGRGHRHAMTPEDLHHLRAVGRATTGGGVDYFGGFAEVRGAHYRRGYDGELFHILSAEVVETVHRAPGDAQRLPRTNLDGSAVNRPGKDALDTV